MKPLAPLQLVALALTTVSAGALAAALPPGMDPTSELAPPPFEITGPEDLENAIEKAKSIEHPNYKEKIRYHRSTHISFPLPKIDDPEDMSRASINDTLNPQTDTGADKNEDVTDLAVLAVPETTKPAPASIATGTIELPPSGPSTLSISIVGR